jgi:mxaJ protein
MIYGDYREEAPPSQLIKAVERGEIDIAAVWGPFAGYFAQTSPVPLKIVAITDTDVYRPLAFESQSRWACARAIRRWRSS